MGAPTLSFTKVLRVMALSNTLTQRLPLKVLNLPFNLSSMWPFIFTTLNAFRVSLKLLDDFPFIESKVPLSEEEILLEFQRRFPSTQNETWKKDRSFKHILSHRKISAQFFNCLCRNMSEENFIPKTSQELLSTGISALLMKYIKERHI